jgi:hypothetical protein
VELILSEPRKGSYH